MTTPTRVRAALIGAGGWARYRYIPNLLDQQDTTEVIALCDPSAENYAAAAQVFTEQGVQAPPQVTDIDQLLRDYADQLDAVFIMTPHKFHHDHAKAALEAGLDVLLEKPMVMHAGEARSLIATRDRTGKHLVVAFQGSLSPQVRKAVTMLREGTLGTLRSISATIWQGWHSAQTDTWRQDPEIAGGGFMFDTGAHMLNTVADLADQDFVEVAAWLDPLDKPVDIMGTVMAKLASGAVVTMHGCGSTIRTCKSDIRVYGTKAILITGAWGEQLKMQKHGNKTFRNVKVEASKGPWGTFLQVRSGQLENLSPPEVGLRMAKLWDAIKASAAQGGAVVKVEN
ncbi:MAG: Gfo/Idh/MocA family oxidoreductase [Anaerolineae bacterium]|nr:Gfo/Idh/MocA family oxidoreductase [Anaerolineae bacterium]